MKEPFFFEPIATGKWSTATIISHLSFWDKYIREVTLPQMKLNAVIESIDFDILNKQAADYALSGVSQHHLLHKQLEERTQLVSDLRKKDEEEFFCYIFTEWGKSRSVFWLSAYHLQLYSRFYMA